MKRVLVVEDEAAIRNNIVRLLKAEGFDAASAEDGAKGLDKVLEFNPDLILSDVNMPGLDGYGLLQAVRAHGDFADTPFIFLTAMDQRDSFRQAMRLGADDYLTKPFTRAELLEAVNTRLDKRERELSLQSSRINKTEEALQRQFMRSLQGVAQDTFSELHPSNLAAGGEPKQATVLFSGIRNFTSLSQRLEAPEVADLLTQYYQKACQPLLALHGTMLRFIGNGVMAVFFDSPEQVNAPRRALLAALDLVVAAQEFRAWLNERFADRALPEFTVGVGVLTGNVVVVHMGDDPAVVGDTVSEANRLEARTRELGWSIAACCNTVHLAGNGLLTGQQESIWLKGDAPQEVLEIIGIAADADLPDRNPVELAEQIRNALRVNSEVTGRAVRAALDATQRMVRTDPTPTIKGYHIFDRIGKGGMSTVYRAQRNSDGQELVLKTLDMLLHQDPELLNRFVQEFTLISQAQHPHVVQIFDLGVTDETVYIAMEYLPGGDLKRLITRGVQAEKALQYLRELASALSVIHARGIVHRDVKPDNVMFREDGTLVLADFGIAKQSEANLAQTRVGEVFGTPYYISPEQATGKPVDARSDLYSLGVIFHELLTRQKPYYAETFEKLVAQHLFAAIPILPPLFERYQLILNQLLAKKPEDRFASADDVVRACEALISH